MPCGNAQLFEFPSDIRDLPIADIPCPCGNPNHYIIRFIDGRYEIGDDLRITNGDDLTNPTTGSPDTSEPKRTRKPKARKKAGKRAG